MEEQRVAALWKEFGESSNSDAGGPESGDELDHLSVHSDHSETKIIEPQPQPAIAETDIFHSTNHIKGRDEVTKWYKPCSTRRVQTKAENIITKLPGREACARSAKTPIKCWQLFSVEDMIADIAQ
ncbi:hypothetical protein JTB14_010248 [Gonioctena quinquepunctata]|nr:hypothetical protein JTB14_010248 [Gonioctena quinquepunctata]